MRKHSIMDRVGLFGRAGIDIVSVLGRSAIFLFHSLLGRGGIGGGFGLLLKQLHSVGVMSLDGQFLAWLLLADSVKPEARQALQELRELGLGRQLLLTGDRQSVADSLALDVGISGHYPTARARGWLRGCTQASAADSGGGGGGGGLKQDVSNRRRHDGQIDRGGENLLARTRDRSGGMLVVSRQPWAPPICGLAGAERAQLADRRLRHPSVYKAS